MLTFEMSGMKINVDREAVLKHADFSDSLIDYALYVMAQRSYSGIPKKLRESGITDESVIIEECRAAAQKRMDNLAAGKWESREGERGPRLDEATKLARELCRKEIEAALTKKFGKNWDKEVGKAKFKELFEKNWLVGEKRHREEAERQIASRARIADTIDLSSLDGDPAEEPTDSE